MTTSPIVAGAMVLLEGFAFTLSNIVVITLRQNIVPNALLGRVTSVYRLIAVGAMPIGALMGGLVARGVRADRAVLGGGGRPRAARDRIAPFLRTSRIRALPPGDPVHDRPDRCRAPADRSGAAAEEQDGRVTDPRPQRVRSGARRRRDVAAAEKRLRNGPEEVGGVGAATGGAGSCPRVRARQRARVLARVDGARLPRPIWDEGTTYRLEHLWPAEVKGVRPTAPTTAPSAAPTGTARSTAPGTGYLAIRLDRKLPHIVLQRRRGAMFYAGDGPELELEGDFGKHFELHVPEGYERDALYVLTPDVMQVLIDEAADQRVEIVDDWLFVFGDRIDVTDPDVHARMHRVTPRSRPRSSRRPTATATSACRGPRRPLAVDRVAPAGRRLPRAVWIPGVVIALAVAALLFWAPISQLVLAAERAAEEVREQRCAGGAPGCRAPGRRCRGRCRARSGARAAAAAVRRTRPDRSRPARAVDGREVRGIDDVGVDVHPHVGRAGREDGVERVRGGHGGRLRRGPRRPSSRSGTGARSATSHLGSCRPSTATRLSSISGPRPSRSVSAWPPRPVTTASSSPARASTCGAFPGCRKSLMRIDEHEPRCARRARAQGPAPAGCCSRPPARHGGRVALLRSVSKPAPLPDPPTRP